MLDLNECSLQTETKRNFKEGVVEYTLMIVHLDRDENCQSIRLKEKACQFARQYFRIHVFQI